jgi:Fe/S biogenesis protein NfuA
MAAPAQEPPTIHFTPEALEKLKSVIEGHRNPVAGLRLEIAGRVNGKFDHILSLVEEGAEPEGDGVFDVDGVDVFVPIDDWRYLDGISIHFEDRGPGQSGLQFDNPNPLWFGDSERKIQEAFDTAINPAIAAHGGFVNLLGVDGDTAYVRLGGGCQGCGMADVTLKQGIEVAIKEAVPEIERVIDATDHASGTNPYYQPSKK